MNAKNTSLPAKKQKQYMDIWLVLNPRITVGEVGRRLNEMRRRGFPC